jgi:sugar phosphate isomerase/epimerase
MINELSMHMIGFQAEPPEAIALAHQNRFQSVMPDAGYLGKLSDGQMRDLLDDLKHKGLRIGAARLAIDFRSDESTFEADLKELPSFAHALQRAGCARIGTYIKPSHETLTYLANFKQHTRRLRAVATVLGDHGQRFGLEYVAPKTSWTAARHPFIHTLAETRELIAEIDRPNVGLMLDSWHWYHAGETEADLLALSGKDIVACDLNDAPAGIPRDQQMDLSRELPCTTGVIDVKTFLGALVKIGYDGPVRPEPFNAELRKLPKSEAVTAAARAMARAFALIQEQGGKGPR